MATIKIEYINGKSGVTGTATKGGVVFQIKDTAKQWKLLSKETAVKVELVWSKKDYTTFEEWKDTLAEDGYVINDQKLI